MEVIKLIEASLSRNRDTIARVFDLETEDIYAQVQQYIHRNTLQWRQEKPVIDYSNPICRLAYIYMNVPIHAFLIEDILHQCEKHLTGLYTDEDKTINVCCLGGGPGSELIGFCAYLLKNRTSQQFNVDFLLIDLVKEWDEYWHSLKQTFDEYQQRTYGKKKNWPVTVHRSFIPLNSLNVSEFKNFSIRLAGINLFIFSYIVSELKSEMEKFFEVFDYLAKLSESGTFFLFIDRDQSEISQQLKTRLQVTNFTILEQEKHLHGSVDFALNELGEWYLKMESLPRRKYQAFFQLAVKN